MVQPSDSRSEPKKDLLSEDQTETLVVEPWNRQVGFVEASSQEQGVMCSFLKANLDFLLGDRHLRGGVDQVAKEMSTLGG
jgi:hypothetical protein